MAERMIRCPKCNRMVCFKQRGYRIYCAECGEEITYSEKDDENISPQHDSMSPKLENTIGGKTTGQGAGESFYPRESCLVFSSRSSLQQGLFSLLLAPCALKVDDEVL